MSWKLWFLICSLVFSLCEASHGQGVISRPVQVGSGPQNISSGWHDLQPCREVSLSSKTLSDIESHIRESAARIYRDHDPITSAHELTHGINSETRQQTGARTNAFYCLNNNVFICREPRLRKSDVCRYVPQNVRGDVWGLYMTGQNEWENTPTYILDEWVAYINGAITGREVASSNRNTDYDIRHCIEFAGYASALLVAIEQLDPSYPDKQRLEDFIAYNVKRTMRLTEPATFTDQVRRFEVAYAPQGNCQGGQCGVMQWQTNVWTPRRVVINNPPAAKPTQPKLVPVVPIAPVSCNCSGEIARIKSEMAELTAHLESISKTQGPAGKDGKDCECGEQLPIKVNFVDGKGKVYTTQLVPSGGTLTIPPIHVQNFARDGKLIDEEKYPVGTPIKLRHGVPSKVK